MLFLLWYYWLFYRCIGVQNFLAINQLFFFQKLQNLCLWLYFGIRICCKTNKKKIIEKARKKDKEKNCMLRLGTHIFFLIVIILLIKSLLTTTTFENFFPKNSLHFKSVSIFLNFLFGEFGLIWRSFILIKLPCIITQSC